MFFWKKKSLYEKGKKFIKQNLKIADAFVEKNLKEGSEEIVNLLKDAKLSDSIKVKENIFGHLIMLLTWYFLIFYFGNYSSDTFVGFTLPVILFYSIISILVYNVWRMMLEWISNRLRSKWSKRVVGLLAIFSVIILGIILLVLLGKNSGQTSFGCGDDGSGAKEAAIILPLVVVYFFSVLFIPSRKLFKIFFLILTLVFITASTVLAFWLMPATYFWGLKETKGYLVFKNEVSFNEFTKNFLAADNFCESSKLRNASLFRAQELFSNAYYDPIGKMYSYRTTEYFQDDKYRYMSSDSRKKKVSISYEFWPEAELPFMPKPYYWKYDNKLNNRNSNSIVEIPLASLSKFLSGSIFVTQSGSLNYSKVLSGLYAASAYEKQNDCKMSIGKDMRDEERIATLKEWLENGDPYLLWQDFPDSKESSCKDLAQFISEYGRNKKQGIYEDNRLDQEYKDFLWLIWSIYAAYSNIMAKDAQILHDKGISTIDDCIQSSEACFPTLKSPDLAKRNGKYSDSERNWSLYIGKLINE